MLMKVTLALCLFSVLFQTISADMASCMAKANNGTSLDVCSKESGGDYKCCYYSATKSGTTSKGCFPAFANVSSQTAEALRQTATSQGSTDVTYTCATTFYSLATFTLIAFFALLI